MKAVHWTIKAKNRLKDIKQNIEEDNPKAALQLVAAIMEKRIYWVKMNR